MEKATRPSAALYAITTTPKMRSQDNKQVDSHPEDQICREKRAGTCKSSGIFAARAKILTYRETPTILSAAQYRQ
jgi:hypothetical protein